MKNYTSPEYYTGSDCYAIQKAVDEACESGLRKVVIPKGEWKLDRVILIPEFTHIHLDGAKLILTEKGSEIFRNSVSVHDYAVTQAYNQCGITVTGENGASLEGGNPIYFHNVSNFMISGLTFRAAVGSGITLTYSYGGRLSDLNFDGCQSGISVYAGTRDCIFTELNGSVSGDFLEFDETKRIDPTVYYHGLEVKNHVVRGVNASAGGSVIVKEKCRNIIVTGGK